MSNEAVIALLKLRNKELEAEIEALKREVKQWQDAERKAIDTSTEFHRCLLAREESLKRSGDDWVKAKEDADQLRAELEKALALADVPERNQDDEWYKERDRINEFLKGETKE